MYAIVFHYYEDPIKDDYVIYNVDKLDVSRYINRYRDERYFKKVFDMDNVEIFNAVTYLPYNFVQYD